MSKETKKISQLCDELASELYHARTPPGKGGQHWDACDDKREISKIAAKIQAIAEESWKRGVHANHVPTRA